MPSYTDRQLSPHSSEQLFALVADIERYPEFLPWCRAARILEKQENRIIAELVVCFKHITERYTSEVRLDPPRCIEVSLLKGPFHHLTNRWRFTPVDSLSPEGERVGVRGTEIEFFLDFKFKSRLLEMAIGGVFSRAAEKMTAAFLTRAAALYGAKH